MNAQLKGQLEESREQRNLKERLDDPLLKAQLRFLEISIGTILSILFFMIFVEVVELSFQPNLRMKPLTISDSDQQLTDIAVYFPPKLSAEDQGELLVTIRNITSEPLTATMDLVYDPDYVFLEADKVSAFTQKEIYLLPDEFYSYRLNFETTSAPPITAPLSIAMTFTSQNGEVASAVVEVPIGSFSSFLREMLGVRRFLLDFDLKLLTSFAGVLASIVWSFIYVIFCKKMTLSLMSGSVLEEESGRVSETPSLYTANP